MKEQKILIRIYSTSHTVDEEHVAGLTLNLDFLSCPLCTINIWENTTFVESKTVSYRSGQNQFCESGSRSNQNLFAGSDFRKIYIFKHVPVPVPVTKQF